MKFDEIVDDKSLDIEKNNFKYGGEVEFMNSSDTLVDNINSLSTAYDSNINKISFNNYDTAFASEIPSDTITNSFNQEDISRKLELSLDEIIEQGKEKRNKSRFLHNNRRSQSGTNYYSNNSWRKANPVYINFPSQYFIGANTTNNQPRKYRIPQSVPRRSHPYDVSSVSQSYNNYVQQSLPCNISRYPILDTSLNQIHQNKSFRGQKPDSIKAAKDSALIETEIIFPSKENIEDNSNNTSNSNYSLIVKFKDTELLKVVKSKGDLILSSGGWKTLSTRLVLNSALKPLGLKIESSLANTVSESQSGLSEKDETDMSPKHDINMTESGNSQKKSIQWRVVDGKFYLATFYDEMVIGQIGTVTRSQLMARASVIAQHLTQARNNALLKRRKNNHT